MTTSPNEPVHDDDIETVGAPAAPAQMGMGDADAGDTHAGDSDAGDSDAGDGASRDGAEGGPLDTQDESDSDGSDA